MVANFVSMFIVVPKISSQPALFGIYSICISIAIYFSYADVGFVSSGTKYASESFAMNDLEEEIKTVGFVSFILFAFVLLFDVVIVYFAFTPTALIANLKDPKEVAVASNLLFMLVLFSFAIVNQRILQVIYGVRVETYIYKKIFIVGSFFKIASVYFCFNNGKADIVEYFVICQLVDLICSVISLLIAKKRYNYDLFLLLRSLRYSKRMFDKTKRLAFGSMYMTLMFVLYYEMDTMAIAKFLGPEELSYYAVGLSLLTFLRTLFSTLYAPFTARFNHFIALKDLDSLRDLYLRIVVIIMPMVLFPIISLVVLMKPFIGCWVGVHYTASVVIAQLLIMSYSDSFYSYPASMLIVAQEKVRMLYVTTTLMTLIFWCGVFTTISHLGTPSFALFKIISLVPTSVIYYRVTAKFLDLSPIDFAKRILSPILPSCLFLVMSLMYLNRYMPVDKHVSNLLVVVSTGGFVSLIALSLYYLASAHFRGYSREFVKKVYDKMPSVLRTAG